MKRLTLLLFLLPSWSFAQLALSEAERLARELNPIMAAANADVEAAKARAAKLTSPYRPMVDLMLYGGRTEGIAMDVGSGLEMFRGSGSGMNAMLSWKLFSGGQDATARRIGQSEIARAQARFGIAWLDLQLEVRTEFAEALRLQDEVKAVEAALESANEIERVTRALFEAGKLPEAFVYGAAADRAKFEGLLATTRAELEGAYARIVACCGAELIGGSVGDWDVPMEVPESLEAAVEWAYSHSPEVEVLEREAEELRGRARQVEQSGLPQLTAFAVRDQIFSGTSMDARTGSQVGLTLSFPLIDGSMRRNESAEMKRMGIEADARVAAMKNTLRAEVSAEWAKWTASAALLESANARVAAADEAYRIAKLRYEEGKTIRAELSTALADQQEARVDLAKAHAYRHVSWARLRYVMGG